MSENLCSQVPHGSPRIDAGDRHQLPYQPPSLLPITTCHHQRQAAAVRRTDENCIANPYLLHPVEHPVGGRTKSYATVPTGGRSENPIPRRSTAYTVNSLASTSQLKRHENEYPSRP